MRRLRLPIFRRPLPVFFTPTVAVLLSEDSRNEFLSQINSEACQHTR